MTNKTLGVIAMLCAPFLCIDFLVHGQSGPNEDFKHTSLSGLFSLIYMIGWTCSIVVLKRISATGTKRFGRFILNAQLITLSFANIWNIYEIIDPAANTTLFFILDMFWPISQLVLIIIGITVIVARRLDGFSRFIPLLAGIWFPVSLVLMLAIGQTGLTMILSGAYSAIMWFLLGYMCFRQKDKKRSETILRLGETALG